MSEGKSKSELQREYDAKFDDLREQFLNDRMEILEEYPDWRGQDVPESEKIYALTRRYYASIKALQQEYAVLFDICQ